MELVKVLVANGYELKEEFKYLEKELRDEEGNGMNDKETDGVTNEMVEEFAESLIGTMDSLNQQFSAMYPEEDFDSLTQEQYELFDSIVFTCAMCGWNYEIGEESGVDEDEMICLNCADEWEEEQ